MTSELIERWRACSFEAAPYTLPGDEALLENKELLHPTLSYSEFVESPVFGAAGRRLHLGLLPIPFAGDVLKASIFILMLNPGFSADDYFGEERVPEYRAALIRNLQQHLSATRYPFYCLDPRFSWHAGFGYWNGRLRGIVRWIATRRSISYQAALSVLARAICAIELVPYHSESFGLPHSLLNKLQSVRLSRAFVHSTLVPRAEAGEAVIIVSRSARYWNVAESKNVVIYRGGETRGAHLSPNTRGGALIMRQLELC